MDEIKYLKTHIAIYRLINGFAKAWNIYKCDVEITQTRMS